MTIIVNKWGDNNFKKDTKIREEDMGYSKGQDMEVTKVMNVKNKIMKMTSMKTKGTLEDVIKVSTPSRSLFQASKEVVIPKNILIGQCNMIRFSKPVT